MSSDSTDKGKVSHYAYLVLRVFPPLPTEISLFRLLAESLFLIEVATSFTNILIWGFILLHYSDLTSPKCVSFRKLSLILLSYCENFRGNCGFFRLALTSVLGDLVFLSSKFYTIICVTSILVHFPFLMKLACIVQAWTSSVMQPSFWLRLWHAF